MWIPRVMAIVAIGLFVACLALAFVPVDVPRIGDTSAYSCPPFGSDPNCADNVRGRRRLVAAAAIGTGVFGGLYAVTGLVLWAVAPRGLVTSRTTAQRVPLRKRDWGDPWTT